ncbi:MAG TPA: hypothetical protein DFR83_16325 [Deltaproteobacteria bacterium]|nr:hypothetical protein [Deltaproteobacteria bacterium]
MEPLAFDAHCHVDAGRLNPAAVWGVAGVVVAGVTPAGFPEQCRAAAQLRGLGCAAGTTLGLHPWLVPSDTTVLRVALADLAHTLERSDPHLVAVGETGLDRTTASSDAQWAGQMQALEAQLDLARSRDLPVVLHVVRAHAECMRCLRRVGVPPAGLQVHAFWGSLELVEAWTRLDAHLSIGPAVVARRSSKRAAALASIPEDRLLVETDASAEAEDGRPTDVWPVIRCLADIRGQTASHIAVRTAENARRLFGLDKDSATPS